MGMAGRCVGSHNDLSLFFVLRIGASHLEILAAYSIKCNHNAIPQMPGLLFRSAMK